MGNQDNAELVVRTNETTLQTVRSSEGYGAISLATSFSGVLSIENISGVERAMMTASALVAIRKALSDDIIREWVLPLMNTPSGFDTDRNPSKGWNGDVYPIATVRECLIEAILHGLPMIGNAWNIIAEGMYVRKEGFEGLLRGRVRMSSSVKIDPAEAKAAAAQQGGGYCRAMVMIQHKRPDAPQESDHEAFKGTYFVRVNARNKVSVEASEGKALRKGYRDLWHSLTGATMNDGDVLEIDPTGQPGVATTVTDTSPSQPPPRQATISSEPGDAPTLAAVNAALDASDLHLEDVTDEMKPPLKVSSTSKIPKARLAEFLDVVQKLGAELRHVEARGGQG